MSWDILPKAKLQYLLTRLKEVFDKKVDKEQGKGLFSGSYNDLTDQPTIPSVSANPSTTTDTLTGLALDGTSYAIPGASAVTGVKGANEQNYRTGNVSLSANNISALYASAGLNINSLNDLVNLLNNSGGQRGYCATVKINSDIGVGVTGWQRILAVSQNGPNNQTYQLGMFCLFFPADTSTNIKWALIDGHTDGAYVVSGTGTLPYTDHTYSAGTGLGLSGSSFYMSIPRVAESCNALPGTASLRFREYTSGSNYNLPSNAYYHILEMRSMDTNYGTQLALGMTTDATYYRKYSGGNWGSWKSLIAPTDTNQLTNGAGYITSSGSCASATKATQDADEKDIRQKYVNVYNSNNINTTDNLSATQLAGGGFCMGMVNSATDNPQGSKKWLHVISLCWSKGSTSSWISQLAMGVESKDGLWYRTSSGNVSGLAWKRVIDSSNIGSQSVASASSASTAGSLMVTQSGVAKIWCLLENGDPTIKGFDHGVILKPNNTWLVTMQGDGNLVIYQNGTAKWNSGTSSQRFKHNIQDMTEERARKILEVRAVTFDWNDDQPATTRQNDNAGVIAEEVSQVIPDLVVFEDAEDGKQIERRVEYERFTPYLIKMVQMQQQEIDLLKEEVRLLKEKVNLKED